MSTPSLLNIPYVIKAGTLYSQIPETGAGDFTVTRATSPANNRSTRINANGFIELVNDNVPRLDYPLGGAVNGCAALLVEPAATNAFFQSEAFGTSPWSALAGATVTPNSILAPDNNLTADTINLDAQAGSRVQQTGLTVANSTTYTFSCFFRNNTLTSGQSFNFQINNGQAAPNDFLVRGTIDTFNNTISYGQVGTAGTGISGTGSAKVENYGNGWYRYSVTATTGTAAASAVAFVQIIQNQTVTTRSFYAWGAQFEVGSVATSYIHTTTQAIARATDVVNKGGIGGLIGQTEGTIYWEGESLASGAQDIISINQSNTNSVYITKITTNVYRCVVIASGTPEVIVDDTVVKTGFVKIAFAYKSGNTALFINGAQVGLTNTTVFTFSGALSSLIFGPGAYYSGRPDQKCRTVALYPNRLSNGDLQTLTA
jgi:hypothetical protein